MLEITVGNWLRALPAEIATGGTPAGTARQKSCLPELEGSLFYGNYTSSMTAISAASPRRGPVRVTLV